MLHRASTRSGSLKLRRLGSYRSRAGTPHIPNDLQSVTRSRRYIFHNHTHELGISRMQIPSDSAGTIACRYPVGMLGSYICNSSGFLCPSRIQLCRSSIHLKTGNENGEELRLTLELNAQYSTSPEACRLRGGERRWGQRCSGGRRPAPDHTA